ncbi:hypothetical protein BG011_002228 [Mortierella polycephala]|uniref:DUF985 domain-containing protein n=1 Tax=Mortierella polycephala TaxID=41804 RepID=A0A9P6PKP2_9FUNG|nr:hypothetical protein BG011_002228 [Mortierella polycephala]
MSGTSNKPHTIDHNISLHHENLIETHSARIPPPLAASLNLTPHPEGGWFRETWVAPQKFHPQGYPALRAAASAIYLFSRLGKCRCGTNYVPTNFGSGSAAVLCSCSSATAMSDLVSAQP